MQLPEYDDPPVVETVVGVQFTPLAGFTNGHLGAFWHSLGAEDWPHTADAPPLPRQDEQFGLAGQWGRALRLQLTQDPAARIQITHRDQTRMVQLQNGRFHLNWLGSGGNQYPGYPGVRADFETHLSRLRQFLADHNLPDLIPDQWEVTYVNHIPKGTIWQSPADWSFFRPMASVPSVDTVIEAESFSGEWHFIIPDKKGRLHVQWQHGKHSDADQAEFIRLTLTARGSVPDTTPEALLNGIDLGRGTIVRAFRNLMDDAANTIWGLKR